ncbi:MAG: signal peptidase I, partial [Bdellovibrionales bacterium]|nr:signal peptidase I [Bdellovibrionales bacterium]
MAEKESAFWKEGFGSFVVAILIALGIRWALVEAYVIPSGSMQPTLLVHDHIFVNKIIYGLRVPFTDKWILEFAQPQKGEVIVFRYPQDPSLFFIKRIVGTPGDRVFYENGYLYVNEEIVPRNLPQGRLSHEINWLSDKDFPGEENQGGLLNYGHWQEQLGGHKYSILLRNGPAASTAFGPFQVPPDHYFVLGDNRDNSRDSRLWSSESTFSQGRVQFILKQKGPKVRVLKGTLVKPEAVADHRAFKTLADVMVGSESVDVEVEALFPGAESNLKPGEIQRIEGSFEGVRNLKVSNKEAFSGGNDDRY